MCNIIPKVTRKYIQRDAFRNTLDDSKWNSKNGQVNYRKTGKRSYSA